MASKISLQMYTLREHTGTMEALNNTVARLKDIGFENLQYSIPAHYDADEVAKIFKAHAMRNDSVYSPWAKLKENYDALLHQCELFDAKAIRIESIPREMSMTKQGYIDFAHQLNDLGAAYKQHGIKILYHFHAFEFIKFDGEMAIETFLKETDPEIVGLNPDTHWIHSGGRDICAFMEKYKDRYNFIHVKDFGITTMGDCWEARPIVFAPVGEGNLEWEPILALCKKNNVEIYAIEQDDCYGRDAFDCVKSSFDHLKKLGVDD